MTLEDFKIRLKNNDKIIFQSSDCDLLKELEKLLLSNGWRWRGHAFQDSRIESLIRNIRHFNNFSLCSNYRLNEQKIISYGVLLNDDNTDDIIELTDEVIKVIKFIFTPIPTYKPKVFDKNI